jgi:hypothetical protein
MLMLMLMLKLMLIDVNLLNIFTKTMYVNVGLLTDS